MPGTGAESKYRFRVEAIEGGDGLGEVSDSDLRRSHLDAASLSTGTQRQQKRKKSHRVRLLIC